MFKFYNEIILKKFEKDGFVVIDLLDLNTTDEVQDLFNLYEKDHNNEDVNLFSSLDNNNLQLHLTIENRLSSLVLPHLKKVIKEFDYVYSTFLVKRASINNSTPFHQDPTLIEAQNEVSANVWIALENSSPKNGSLYFIPGSHKIIDSLVVTPDFYSYYYKIQNKLSFFKKDISLKKGQAVIFNNKLIHGANPNTSNNDRISPVLSIKSPNTNLCYYYLEKKEIIGTVDKYYLNKSDYSLIEKNQKPITYLKKTTFKYQFKTISYKFFLQKMFIDRPIFTMKALAKSIFK